MMNRLSRFLCLAGLLLTCQTTSNSLWAAATPAQSDEGVKSARLISELSATGNREEVLLGLDITLDDGWHTYWRTPGTAGAPPTLDWSGSSNVKEHKLLFPAPVRETIFGIDSIGYTDGVLFPLRVKLQDPTKPADLTLNVTLLVCKEMCLPKNFTFTLSLPAG